MKTKSDDVREMLNPIGYREMRRRGWTDEHIAILLDVSIHTLRQFKRRHGLIQEYKKHSRAEGIH